MKIDLLPTRQLDHWKNSTRNRWIMVRASLPYWQSRQGGYVHRIRDGACLNWDDGIINPHVVFRCWCGYSGHLSRRKGRLLTAPGPRDVVCATCEGRIIGAARVGAPVINGQPVQYAPRMAA